MRGCCIYLVYYPQKIEDIPSILCEKFYSDHKMEFVGNITKSRKILKPSGGYRLKNRSNGKECIIHFSRPWNSYFFCNIRWMSPPDASPGILSSPLSLLLRTAVAWLSQIPPPLSSPWLSLSSLSLLRPSFTQYKFIFLLGIYILKF